MIWQNKQCEAVTLVAGKLMEIIHFDGMAINWQINNDEISH